MLYVISVAAANAPVGTDLIAGQTWRISNRPRVVRRVALTGSAAAGDTEVELFVGNLRVGVFYSSALGAPQNLRDTFMVAHLVPAGSPLVANVATAPATNPLFFLLELE